MAEACTWVPMVHDKKQFSRFLHSPLPTNTNMHAMVWLCMGKTLIEVIDTPPCPHARPHARRATPRIAAREGAAPALAARAGAAPARAARACAAHARAAHDRVARAGAAHDRAVLAHPRPTCAPRMPMRAPMPGQHT